MLKKLCLSTIIASSTILYGISVEQLNSASKYELMKINGVGEAKATAIIEYRESSKFKTIGEVIEVKGIGKVLAKNIKESDSKVKIVEDLNNSK